jgi:hypothetical protein
VHVDVNKERERERERERESVCVCVYVLSCLRIGATALLAFRVHACWHRMHVPLFYSHLGLIGASTTSISTHVSLPELSATADTVLEAIVQIPEGSPLLPEHVAASAVVTPAVSPMWCHAFGIFWIELCSLSLPDCGNRLI